MYAGYHQLSRVQPMPDTFEEMLERYPQMFEYGRYHHNLQPFLRLFPRERFHLILFEDIKTDPVACYRDICRFLGIDPSFVPQSMHERVNPRTVLRSRALRNLRCAIADFMSRTPVTRRARAGLVRLGAARLSLKLFNLNERPGTVPPLAPGTRRRLVDYYREDTEALGELLQRDLSHWSQ
jgi:hypothetical protein